MLFVTKFTFHRLYRVIVFNENVVVVVALRILWIEDKVKLIFVFGKLLIFRCHLWNVSQQRAHNFVNFDKYLMDGQSPPEYMEMRKSNLLIRVEQPAFFRSLHFQLDQHEVLHCVA